MQYKGMNILITGGAGDIGFSVARRFSSAGAHIILTDLKEDKLQERQQEIIDAGGSADIYIADVTDSSSIHSMVKAIELKGMKIDFLFNNAGYQGDFKKTFEYPEDDFRMVMEINLIGAFNVLKIVSAHMVRTGGGAIVNTASMAGVDGPPNMIAYGASKFAVIGMTESAAKDLAPYNIRVNSIAPAFMGPGYMWDRQVEMQAKADSQYFDKDPEVVAQQMIDSVPMRRYGDLSEIPGTVSFLMGKDASYITGVNIPISGGI
ncbi:MAG: SDR family oxidoreductase [Spirochaetaceae bacterium]|nr:SDR family oxidoreductase [Spirochaetaceae bacterium]MCF7938678.1 SDR family oxidoreductase [Spirochaetales bacterium]